MRVGSQGRLSTEELILLNCGVREDSWEPLGQQGNQTSQSQIFIGRTNAKVEVPIFWPPDVKSWLIGKYPDAGKDWGQEKGTTEDEMVGWHHWLDGHEFEQTLGDGERQGSLVCCSPCGHKESDIAERLNNNKADLEEDREYGWFPQPPERSTHRTKRTGY